MSESTTLEKVVTPEFDWSVVGKKQDQYSEADRQKLEDLYEKTLKTVHNLEVIEGTVVAVNAREVVINIGYKSDGVIPRNEFKYNPDIKAGDKIPVFVEQQEDAGGQLILSPKRARATASLDRICKALETNEIIKGY